MAEDWEIVEDRLEPKVLDVKSTLPREVAESRFDAIADDTVFDLPISNFFAKPSGMGFSRGP